MSTTTDFEKIKLILSDVDGVLTDGGISFDNNGVESKQFHIKDGLGIKMWQRAGFRFGILTARTSHIVKVRSAELGIDIVRQGFESKLPTAETLAQSMNLSLEEVCYIGDDLTDLPVIRAVGLGVAVADAVSELLSAADLVTQKAGGKGAVRELIEQILRSTGRWDDLVQQYYSG
ncbi:MAG: HAD hydrolase family protein [Planctomycetaceae bacterium]|nr:phenylphosphate carboxylase subunit delta [Planctomycetaceae bacterium]|tara:strand:+ start:579 stop:1103 length:525 start_codon:yes stop_codon:yes gene_type:complete